MTGKRFYMSKTYTVKQVAQALGFSTNTVYKYLDEGKIKATRLGTEGRFRVPEGELTRLLGEKQPSTISPEPSLLSTPETQPSLTTQIEQKFILLEQAQVINKIRLFEWFNACLGIFLGASALLFPPLLIGTVNRGALDMILYVKSSLIFFGITFILSDLFLGSYQFRHLVINIVYGLVFGSLAILFFQTHNISAVATYGTIGLLAFLGVWVGRVNYLRFLILAHLLGLLIGFVLIFRLEDLKLGFISFLISQHILWVSLLWFGLVILATFLNLRSFFQNRTNFIGALILAGLSGVICLASIFANYWDQALFTGVMMTFLLFLPLWKKIEFIRDFKRKDFFSAISWLLLVPVIGISVAFYVQKSFEDDLKKNILDHADKAAALVELIMNDAQVSARSFKDSPELISLLSDKNSKISSIDLKVKDLYLTSRTFKRLFLTDEKGKTLSLYPTDPALVGFDLSSRDYFQNARSNSNVFVSNVVNNKINNAPPALLLSVSVRSADKKLLGVISGSLELKNIEDKLNELKIDSKTNFRVAESKKNYLIHPNSAQIAQKAADDSVMSKAVNGETGITEVYNEQGEFSLRAHAPIRNYNWGLVEEQPLSDLIKPTLTTSFLIYLATTISGIAAFLCYIYLKKKEYEQ